MEVLAYNVISVMAEVVKMSFSVRQPGIPFLYRRYHRDRYRCFFTVNRSERVFSEGISLVDKWKTVQTVYLYLGDGVPVRQIIMVRACAPHCLGQIVRHVETAF